MIDKLIVPEALHRNAPNVTAAGYEHTGQTLINYATRVAGLQDLRDVDVLDIGCGVRFTMAIINRNIPIGSYTGVEVEPSIVRFLKENVEAYDHRFKFARWDVQNAMYNENGKDLAMQEELPIDGSFGLIWLFSVFTHLYPRDSLALLRLLRKYIRSDGKLFFSVAIDDEVEEFDDRLKDKPLWNAVYGREYMKSLIGQGGWNIEALYERDPSNFIQHHVLCSPA